MAVCNESLETSLKHRQGFAKDDGMVTTICLFVLILANLILTTHFYLSWKRRRNYLHAPKEIRRKQKASVRFQSDPQREKDEVYADIRESYFSNSEINSGTYKFIDPDLRHKGSYGRLKKMFSLRGRNRDKMKTLTALFDTHSQDVHKTVKQLKSSEITTE